MYDFVKEKRLSHDHITAAELVTTLTGLTEDLAAFDLGDSQINALMDVVAHYCRHAQTEAQQNTAAAAYDAIKRVITLWGVIREYRPLLWQFTNAAARYERERYTAITIESYTECHATRQTADNTTEQ